MNSMTEARLNKFTSKVMADAKRKSDELEAELAREKSTRLEKSRDEFLQEAYSCIQDCAAKLQKENNERVRTAEFEAKKVILKKREEIIDRVFDRAAEKLREFYNGADYEMWLSEKLERALKEVGAGAKEVYLTERDAKALAGKLPENVTVTEVSDKEFWGGVRVKNSERGIMADYSFYELLKSERGGFLQKSGLTVG